MNSSVTAYRSYTFCGEEFTVPSDVVQRTYIGILGRPRIQIDVASPDELEEKGIVFEQVDLPERR